MSVGRVIAAIVGGVLGLIALVLLASGALVAWAYASHIYADGFFGSTDIEMRSAGYALVSDEVDIATGVNEWWSSDLATARLSVESTEGGEVFIGIGPFDDVEDYLSGVAHDEVVSIHDGGDDITYRHVPGGAPAEPPGQQTFWAVSQEGTGEQTVEWDIEQGSWAIVVMNADPSAPVSVSLDAGLRIAALVPVIVGVIVAGVVLAGIAIALIIWAFSGGGAAAAVTPPGAALGEVPGRGYPAWIEGSIDPGLSRWLWLVKWFLAIPHYIVLFFLWIGFFLLTIIAWISILFTARYPRGIFDFNVGVLRWSWRVSYYAFSPLSTDRYPPFALSDTDYPAKLDVAYPESLSRGLALIKWWLLAIPHYIVLAIFTGGGAWWYQDAQQGDGVGLIGILTFFAAVVLLFTAHYPRSLFDLVMGLNRWGLRVAAYAALMRDEYPPFRLDMGGAERSSVERAEADRGA